MKHIKKISFFLVLALIFQLISFPIIASDTVDFNIIASPELTTIGKQVTLTVSLKGYTSEADAIRGLQVDIDDVDTDVLKVIEYSSLIEDSSAISNTASYNEANRRLRLVYVQISNTLPAPCEKIFKVVLQINPNLTEDGSITLPVTLKMQTVTDRITLNSECVINYTKESTPVTSVDLTWGALNYTYSGETWNPETHSFEGGKWSDNGSGFVTVQNTGETDITADFSYQTARTDISGEFSNGDSVIVDPITISPNQTCKAYLLLSGKPNEELIESKIGKVVVSLGGD